MRREEKDRGGLPVMEKQGTSDMDPMDESFARALTLHLGSSPHFEWSRENGDIEGEESLCLGKSKLLSISLFSLY